jgi:hypothetical protein
VRGAAHEPRRPAAAGPCAALAPSSGGALAAAAAGPAGGRDGTVSAAPQLAAAPPGGAHGHAHARHARHAPAGPAPDAAAARALTRAIAAATTPAELEALAAAHDAELNPIHVAALLSRAAKLAAGAGGGPGAAGAARALAARRLLPLFERRLSELGPRGTANALWALAKAEAPLPPALLGSALDALARHGPELEGQHVSSVVWALAEWARQPGGGGEQRDGADAVPGGAARLKALLAASAGALAGAGTQAHANTLYGLACLGHRPPPAWLDAFWAASAPALPGAQPQHLSNLLWAAARLDAPPPAPWLDAWAAASRRRLLRSTPQGCSNMLWAAARLGWRPPAAWMAAWLASTRPRLVAFSPQALSNSFWALGRLAALQSEAGGSEGSGSSESSSSGGESSRESGEQQKSEESLQQRRDSHASASTSGPAAASGSSMGSSSRHGSSGGGSTATGFEAAGSGSALPGGPDVEGLTAAWAADALAAAQGQLRGFSPQALANTLWGLGTLRAAGRPAGSGPAWLAGGPGGGGDGGSGVPSATAPPPQLAPLIAAAARHMAALSPQELSNALLGVARLRAPPGPAWMALFEAASARQLAAGAADPQHHGNMLWAMAALGHRPGDAWLAALLGDAEARLRRAIGDGGSGDPGYSLDEGPEGGGGSSNGSSGGGNHTQTAETDAAGYTDQGLEALAWGLARTAGPGRVPPCVWAALEGAAAAAVVRGAGGGSRAPRLVATLLWAAGVAGREPSPEFATALAGGAAARAAARAGLQDCAVALWAHARGAARPPPGALLPWIERAGELLTALPGHGRGEGPAAVASDPAAAAAAAPAPDGHAAAAGGHAADADGHAAAGACHAVALAVWSLGRLGFHPGSPWMRRLYAATGRAGFMAACSPRQLAMLAWGAAALREAPPAAWRGAWAHAWRRAEREGRVGVADAGMARAAAAAAAGLALDTQAAPA